MKFRTKYGLLERMSQNRQDDQLFNGIQNLLNP
jgi:hypothetical protein